MDEPLRWLLADPRRFNVTALYDNLWLRLLDVPRALAARTYGSPGRLALEVTDPFLSPAVQTFHLQVWERSTAGIRIARELPVLQEEYRRALPGFTREDVAGSPYCVHCYVVDEHLGGPKGLAKARKELAKRNMRLILDFVPNHVAPDHPWVLEHPEYFIQGSADDCAQKTGEFFQGREYDYCLRP